MKIIEERQQSFRGIFGVQKFLQIVGILALALFCVIGIGAGVVAYKGHTLDVTSKAYVDSAIPAITDQWNQTEFLSRATLQLRKSITPDQLTAFFDGLALLGPLTKYDGSSGQSDMSFINGVDRISASYVANAQFKNGSAIFHIVLIKLNGQWMIDGFHVDPKIGNSS